MSVMRNLTTTHRLQALSVPEITDEFERLALEYARGLKFRGGKLRQGHVLNAAVLHFLSLPEAERGRIVRENLARLEALLDDDGPDAIGGPDGTFGAGGPASPAKGRKRRA